MNARIIAACFALFVCFAATSGDKEPKTSKEWALLVAGSNTWGNYRHQADVCHAYQILHAHGIPDENIVVMMYDDIANNKKNPTKGIVINHPNGDDVYAGVVKDYVGKDVTPDNFINVLTGNKAALKGVGSGKVIDSGPDDHVFVNFVDHGGFGLLGFPNDVLTTQQLNDTITKLYNEKRYGKLVFYIEACDSGSLLYKTLPNDISVYATTASSPRESSYACYYDIKRKTYLGDWYSVNWMEDSDKEDIEQETLEGQYEIVKKETNTSHVQEYGELDIGGLDVGGFQGPEEAPSKSLPKPTYERGSPSLEVPLDMLYRELAAAEKENEKEHLRREIDALIQKRGLLEATVKKIVARVAVSLEQKERLISTRPQAVTQLQCHNDLVKAFSRNCFNFGKNSYALKYAYILANMCDEGLNANDVIRTMEQVCKSVPVKAGIE